nr:type I phosphodiesterase/nucleotide pyrophosphatase [uncultured bacterium]
MSETVLASFGVTGLAALLLLARISAQQPARQERDAPRLVVIVVIDQFRADMEDLYKSQWSRGLTRIFGDGAVFTNAQYPFGRTSTCGGHATISTGTLPPTQGIIDNSWFDRATDKTVNCTDDNSVVPIGIGGTLSGKYGPALLMAPTLGDEMAAQMGPGVRVVGSLERLAQR